MLAKIFSGANVGLDAKLVVVEVDIASQGLPSVTIVGLGDRAIEESKERVRSGIKNSGMDFPAKRITINLAPADLPKEGPSFDLPMAIGLLVASGQIPKEGKTIQDVEHTLFLGELSLDGELRRVPGVLPISILAKKSKIRQVIVPEENGLEAAVIDGVEVFACSDLKQVAQLLLGQIEITPLPLQKLSFEEIESEYDFAQVKGQEQAKRALEIAASGGHNILLKGPPGAGKTLLARSFPSILPPLSFEEALEVTAIYSVSGKLDRLDGLITRRPFRSPHHSASHVGIIGGGGSIKPGEVSLAHRGTLFLDEIPEFPRLVLEALRQPLEDHHVTISRASGTLSFPAQFILLAAQNPCPCGFLGDKTKSCSCAPGQIAKYGRRLSGPLMDRIDIHLEVPAVDVEKLTHLSSAESSKSIRDRVIRAREIQSKRFKSKKIFTNSEMGNSEIKLYCLLAPEGLDLIKRAISSMHLSARGYHRVLKISRTIADLAGSENILPEHLAESLQYRAREEN